MEILIVTGMSGAGKSRAMDVLEDLGYSCIDNMPVDMIPLFAELFAAAGGRYERPVIAADIRTLLNQAGDDKELSFAGLLSSLDRVAAIGVSCDILFLEASNDAIIRRYKETRRKHPLMAKYGSLEEAVATERVLLAEVRERAGYIADTSDMSVSRLRDYMISLFDSEKSRSDMVVRILSFGFKYGIPAESDLVFDVRFLPNPFYLPDLRYKGGQSREVWDYVNSFPQTGEFTSRLFGMTDFLLPQYVGEGRSSLVVSIGCTGGQHRSVAIAERLGEHLSEKGVRCVVTHRDLAKNMSELQSREE